ncbi:MAG: glycerol-3-phosphate acyltransferase [Candidatus Heimdallarchaeota archaeon]|nr:glycerol-3-phosphate acyltransferase [Candidatus Heimdallarchaeota archaeon]
MDEHIIQSISNYVIAMALLDILWIGLACIGSYLLGSIPFPVILGKLFKGMDIREKNTKNPGGFNAVRTFGLKIGFPIMFLEFFKGSITIILIDKIFALDYFIAGDGSNFAHSFMCILGPALCVLGHNYNVWLKFKGGQGLGVFMGTIFYVNPLILSLYLFLFILMIGLFKMKTRSVGIIIVILCIIPGLFLPLSPPWANISLFWTIGSPAFIFPIQTLLIVSMDIALLIKLFHNLFVGSNVGQEKVLETRK